MTSLLLLIGLWLPQAASPTPDFVAGLAGHWTGSLTYADYASGQPVAIPARVTIEVLEPRARWLARVAFSDPERELRSQEVSELDLQAGTLVTHAFDGGEPERSAYTIAERSFTDARQWTLVLSTRGVDDGRPADIRETRRLDGERLSVRREARIGEADDWFLRNELLLERHAPAADALVGTWRVDLRPTPDAQPYFSELRLSLAPDGALQANFYGSAADELRVNRDWGTLQLAFVTADGSGPYHTRCELQPDGSLRGTTHSLGRDFLAVWTAQRD